MHALERRRRILEILAESSFLSVEDAEKKLEASPATIRRDFNELAHQGLVVRGHGGVHRLDNAPIMGVLTFSRRKVEHPEGKVLIAKVAAGLLMDGDIVIIDGGTTTVNLAQYLPQHVRVVTNSLPLASALNEPGNGRVGVPEVNMTGGYVYPRSEVLLGPQTVKSLTEYSADWTFLGAGGITAEGVFNSNNLIVDTQRTMIERATKLVILVDGTKFKGPAMMKVCDLSMVDYIVTDEKPPAELLEACREHKVEVVVAN